MTPPLEVHLSHTFCVCCERVRNEWPYWSRMPCAANAWLGSSGLPFTANSMMHPTKSWLPTCPLLCRTGSRDRMPPTVTRFGWTSRVLQKKEKHTSTDMTEFSGMFHLKRKEDNFFWHGLYSMLHLNGKHYRWMQVHQTDTYRII